jgi:inward rectifier potassium channel
VSQAEVREARPDPAADQDLGFGAVVARESQTRLLNRDGSFNVVREGLRPMESLSAYHWLLTVTWPRFLLLVSAGYVLVNAAFGAAYFALGPNALGGDDGSAWGRFWLDFFFSVHTFATIGYGTVHPETGAAHLLVTLESLVGLLGVALVTGLVFARFSRPIARIIFSRKAVIAPYRDQSAFMVRLVNGRSNQIIELKAKVALSWHKRDGQPGRDFHELELEREGVTLFPLSLTLVHPVGPGSPLYGTTEEELRRRDAEFFVVITGMDETFAQQVHARTSYKADEIAWAMKFSDIFLRRPGEPLGIDIGRIHDIQPAALPEVPPPAGPTLVVSSPGGGLGRQ